MTHLASVVLVLLQPVWSLSHAAVPSPPPTCHLGLAAQVVATPTVPPRSLKQVWRILLWPLCVISGL